jgi:hypothetical protein
MIISISGKAGSGKDTVGNIIQYLTAQLSSKNTMSYEKWDTHPYKQASYNWQIKKYSDKLKDMVCILIGCTREELEDQQFKDAPLGEEWKRIIDLRTGKVANTGIIEVQNIARIHIMTPRDILQSLGTDFGRDMLHPNVWVNALFAEYKFTDLAISKYRNAGFSSQNLHGDPYPNWIITDSRFPNDVKRTHKMGGILIRVNRAECEGRTNEHVSETALDDFNEWDYVIENNGTIEELIGQVRTILEEAGIIKKSE